MSPGSRLHDAETEGAGPSARRSTSKTTVSSGLSGPVPTDESDESAVTAIACTKSTQSQALRSEDSHELLQTL